MLLTASVLRSNNSSRVSSYKRQLTLHTASDDSYSGAVRRKRRTILVAKSKLLYSEMVLSWKPFAIGHVYIYTFLLRMTDTVISQNTDISFWDTLYTGCPRRNVPDFGWAFLMLKYTDITQNTYVQS